MGAKRQEEKKILNLLLARKRLKIKKKYTLLSQIMLLQPIIITNFIIQMSRSRSYVRHRTHTSTEITVMIFPQMWPQGKALPTETES